MISRGELFKFVFVGILYLKYFLQLQTEYSATNLLLGKEAVAR